MANPATADSNPLALESVNSAQSLTSLLSLLFEPSPVLTKKLVPQVKEQLPAIELSTYCGLIDTALEIISKWDDKLKAEFIAGHPRIGEVKPRGGPALSGLRTLRSRSLA